MVEVQMNQCSVFKGINRGLCAAGGSCSVVEVQAGEVGERWYDAAGLAVWWRFRWREEV